MVKPVSYALSLLMNAAASSGWNVPPLFVTAKELIKSRNLDCTAEAEAGSQAAILGLVMAFLLHQARAKKTLMECTPSKCL